ncbi:MAG: pseudouridine synthase [Eubacterium sp.]|nr:pseudouridine synthase [Eubacterium sp.]
MRINKYLAESGLCSRREADRLLVSGRVTVDGMAAEPGMQVGPESLVLVDGAPVKPKETKTYLKLYKPVGIVCTFEKREKNNLTRIPGLPSGVTYAGRLDKNSEGLLLLTDDGDLIQAAMTARSMHEKEYLVTVRDPLTKEFLDRMAGGVYLAELEVTTRKCRVRQEGERSFSIILTQGLNRQIRRMCKACGNKVTKLKRVRVVNILLDDMKPGEIRELTKEELTGLRQIVIK